MAIIAPKMADTVEKPLVRQTSHVRRKRFHPAYSVPQLIGLVATILLLVTLAAMVIYLFSQNAQLARRLEAVEQRMTKLENVELEGVKTHDSKATPREDLAAFLGLYTEPDDGDGDDQWDASGDYASNHDVSDGSAENEYADNSFVFEEKDAHAEDHRPKRDADSKKGKKGGKDKPVKCNVVADKNKGLTFKPDGAISLCSEKLNNFIQERIEEKVPMTAIHFSADIPLTNEEKHQLQRDKSTGIPIPGRDGKMYHQGFMPNSQTMAFWKQADWTKNKKVNDTYKFDPEAGSVEILKEGLYFLYAQVHFHENQAYLGYHVRRHSGDHTKSDKVFSCFTGVDPIPREPGEQLPASAYLRHQFCSSSGSVHLKVRDRVFLHNYSAHSKIDEDKDTTYWGLIHLAQTKQ